MESCQITCHYTASVQGQRGLMCTYDVEEHVLSLPEIASRL